MKFSLLDVETGPIQPETVEAAAAALAGLPPETLQAAYRLAVSTLRELSAAMERLADGLGGTQAVGGVDMLHGNIEDAFRASALCKDERWDGYCQGYRVARKDAAWMDAAVLSKTDPPPDVAKRWNNPELQGRGVVVQKPPTADDSRKSNL